MLYEGLSAMELGDLERARALLRQASKDLAQQGQRHHLTYATVARASLHARRGDVASLRALLPEATAMLEGLGLRDELLRDLVRPLTVLESDEPEIVSSLARLAQLLEASTP